MSDSDIPIETWIRALPKAERHLHLEGGLPWALLCEACPDKYNEPPASWAKDFRFESFSHFESELLGYAADYYTSAERYHTCAKAVFAEKQASNVRYLETSIASGVLDFFELDAYDVIAAIRDAVPDGLEVRLFLGIHHSGYSERMKPVIDRLIENDALDGIDLHGAEDEPLGDWAPHLWERAREHGKMTKAHAGEMLGAEFVDYAIQELKAERIQHGGRAAEKDQTVDQLRTNGIALDLCPISNVKLGMAKDMASHPIRQLVDAGICCTLNTDDPLSFGNRLEDEYLALHDEAGFSKEELAQLARNGFYQALAPKEWVHTQLQEIDKTIAV